MKKKIKTVEIILAIILAIQLLTIIVLNITRLAYVTGFDSSAAMAQAMEIWKTKSIFLKHWSYQSSLGLDSGLLIASFIYGFIGNIFIAYGIANCIMIGLYIFVINGILREINISKSIRLFMMIVLFTPYSIGSLGYASMLFSHASYYSMKVLIPFMLIFLLIKITKNRPLGEYIVIATILGIMTYLTAFSSGLYILVSGILPIFAYELYMAICSGNIKNIISKRLIVYALVTVLYILGYITTIWYGKLDFMRQMRLCSINSLGENISNFLLGFLELFGVVNKKEYIVFSREGIYSLIHLLALIIFIVLTVRFIKRTTAIKRIYYGKSDSIRCHIIALQEFIIILNSFILIMVNSSYESGRFVYRYLLIILVASFIIFAASLDEYLGSLKHGKRKLLYKTAWTMLISVWILANAGYITYFEGNGHYEEAMSISEALENVNQIIDKDTKASYWYFVGDGEIVNVARLMRLYEKDITIADGKDLYNIRGEGAKNNYSLVTNYNGEVYLLVSEKDQANINDIEAHGYNYVISVVGYRVYIK